MKHYFFILALFITSENLFAQSDLTKIGLYVWKEAVPMTSCNINGKTKTPPEIVISKPNQKFRVLRSIQDAKKLYAIIQILEYKKNPNTLSKENSPDFFKYNFNGDIAKYNALTPEQKNSENYDDEQKYFKIEMDIVDKWAVRETKIGIALSSGIINFPFKFRPQKGKIDFSGAFNFGAGLGVMFPHKSRRPFTQSLISGYSISNLVLDSSSVTNKGKLASTNVNNFTAFSFSLGYVLEYQKRVQVGIFIGWDFLSRRNQNEFKWDYQGKTWLSVGFGFAIFSPQKEKDISGGKQMYNKS